jgi:D-alanyl-lipoteichoic acid acyltransferase DltB (MBOAT superfamily)
MLRCMSNNYSLEQFWKGWHASFNKWIVRYMYVPMGGRTKNGLIVWPIFFFVAIWHDVEIKLLLWGALNSVFFGIEILAKRLAAQDVILKLPPAARHLLCAFSGSVYILVLISVNLVGYAVGVGGFASVAEKFCTWEGGKVLVISLYFLTVGTSIMIFLRDRNTDQYLSQMTYQS